MTIESKTPYTLYTAATPNGWKASICLEELGVPYTVVPIQLAENEQKQDWFLKLNPNGRIPVLVDHEQSDFALFESGALMLYLAERHGLSGDPTPWLPEAPRERSLVVQWLMFQMSAVGPMMGQANVFHRYAPEKMPWAIERYQRESRRLFEVLDRRLAEVAYLAGDYSIADVATWSWTHTARWSGVDSTGLQHLARWHDSVKVRPAVRRGKEVPAKVELPREEDAQAFAERARKMLV